VNSSDRRVHLPHEEWRRLGWRRRREVARYARRQTRHPDAYVASVAQAWALQLAPPNAPRPGVASRLVYSVGWIGVVAVAAALVGDLAEVLIPGGDEWRERRLARRILAADAPGH
jgi:hypothetical protein